MVFGMPDPRYGQQVAAVASVACEAAEAPLIAHVKERLAGFKAPKQIGFMAIFRRGPNGKADYAAAKAAFGSTGQSLSALLNRREHPLRRFKLWCVAKIGERDAPRVRRKPPDGVHVLPRVRAIRLSPK